MANRDAPPVDARYVRRRLEHDGFAVAGDLPPIARFGDGPQASELAELVRAGKKRATASLLWRWQAEHGGPPLPGYRQVIVDWQGEPRAVIEMTEIEVVPYDEVGADFARAEGEGDLSLEYWREIHWDFFTRESERLGREPDEKMPVVCMRFRVVHSLSD